ncbi:FtsL-like putative cell division protein [Flavihumibacter petaseus]|uniref:Cell division protein FtsL n=1 Tax=Flavihumibacter petaseus NBRC 106054 TaxID=1220578 RepID=A0A0E9N4T3_9BACT|nr:FtsL-like putative cell division protein [Flavihumibacter petaseus]GAO44962.1 hypothetical protein FPE01S_04_02050 [Flavihumibacter petaseus NBRC 106054]
MEQPGKIQGKRFRFTNHLVVKNLPFLLFLSVLAVLYIYNGHYSDKIIKSISRTNRELRELEYEFKTMKSEVMFRSKQTELAHAVEPLGLKELVTPPMILVDSTLTAESDKK